MQAEPVDIAPAEAPSPQSRLEQAQQTEKAFREWLRVRHPADKSITTARITVRDICVGLLFDASEFAVAKEVEQFMWKAVYYRPIEEYRKLLRKYTHNIGDPKYPNARADLAKQSRTFAACLAEAMQFYEGLITRLRDTYDLALDTSIFPHDADRMPAHTLRAYVSVHRSLVFAGDLARYKELHGTTSEKDFSAALVYYNKAQRLMPANGNPHNQMAVTSTYSDDELHAAYHYMCSLAVAQPFATARDNVNLLFDKNRALDDRAQPPPAAFLTRMVRVLGCFYTRRAADNMPELMNSVLGQTIHNLIANRFLDAETALTLTVASILAVHHVKNIPGTDSPSFVEVTRALTSQGIAFLFRLGADLIVHAILTPMSNSGAQQVACNNLPNVEFLSAIGVLVDYLRVTPDLMTGTDAPAPPAPTPAGQSMAPAPSGVSPRAMENRGRFQFWDALGRLLNLLVHCDEELPQTCEEASQQLLHEHEQLLGLSAFGSIYHRLTRAPEAFRAQEADPAIVAHLRSARLVAAGLAFARIPAASGATQCLSFDVSTNRFTAGHSASNANAWGPPAAQRQASAAMQTPTRRNSDVVMEQKRSPPLGSSDSRRAPGGPVDGGDGSPVHGAGVGAGAPIPNGGGSPTSWNGFGPSALFAGGLGNPAAVPVLSVAAPTSAAAVSPPHAAVHSPKDAQAPATESHHAPRGPRGRNAEQEARVLEAWMRGDFSEARAQGEAATRNVYSNLTHHGPSNGHHRSYGGGFPFGGYERAPSTSYWSSMNAASMQGYEAYGGAHFAGGLWIPPSDGDHVPHAGFSVWGGFQPYNGDAEMRDQDAGYGAGGGAGAGGHEWGQWRGGAAAEQHWGNLDVSPMKGVEQPNHFVS